MGVAVEGFSASFVDDSRRRSHVGVAECFDILFQKVDEPAFALEQRQKLQGRDGRTRLRNRRCPHGSLENGSLGRRSEPPAMS
jgi:hypothetical protein